MVKPLRRILYAEDEPDIQEVAAMALEMVGGFELKICPHGLAALEAVADYQPDLLLLDVMMPEMDGPTAFRAIREMAGLASLPVIFMTAKIQPDEVARYQEMGALDVIPKPFDPMTLADTVRAIWERETS